MPDKAQNSHIERTVWIGRTDASPGSRLRYGSWEDHEHAARQCRECYGSGSVSDRSWRDVRCAACGGSGQVDPVPLTLIELATGSDYSGTLVERSNARVLKEQFPWLVEIYGGHGTFGLAYLGKRENQSDALIEAIDALTGYPLADDEDHSNLEHEMAEQAWGDYGRDDFKRALVKYFNEQYAPDEHDLDSDEFNASVDQLWWDCTERLCGGEAHLNQQGGEIYFPIDSVIKKIERCWPGLDKPAYDGTRPSINVQLLALAERATIESEEP